MKELDFLPQWYKDRKRRRSLVRKQYIALACVFLLMMVFNLTTMHRANRVAADVTQHDDQRTQADTIVHEFSRITKELNQMKGRADVVSRIDNQFDIGTILAEISHVVDESVVLSKIELAAEPFGVPADNSRPKGVPTRAVSRPEEMKADAPLGNSKLRVTLSGMATQPACVADLVCRLDDSSYFQQVRPSFYSRSKIQVGTSGNAPRLGGKTLANAGETLDVTTFEIVCYLANYREIEEQ